MKLASQSKQAFIIPVITSKKLDLKLNNRYLVDVSLEVKSIEIKIVRLLFQKAEFSRKSSAL